MIEMIWQLQRELGIPAESLVKQPDRQRAG